MTDTYKKMAGTAAVFVLANLHANKPVERDGMVWSAQELHLDRLPKVLLPRPSVASTLALEGLESYDPASHGELRVVTNLNARFVYLEPIKGWVEYEPSNNQASYSTPRNTARPESV